LISNDSITQFHSLFNRVQTITSEKIDSSISDNETVFGCHTFSRFRIIFFYDGIFDPVQAIFHAPMRLDMFSKNSRFVGARISCITIGFINGKNSTKQAL
jgi:hypothetical protein